MLGLFKTQSLCIPDIERTRALMPHSRLLTLSCADPSFSYPTGISYARNILFPGLESGVLNNQPTTPYGCLQQQNCSTHYLTMKL